MSGRLLVVDDDPSVRRSLSEGMTEEGYEVRSASSAEEALPLLALSPRPELILSDVRVPGLGGVELLELIRERAPGVDVVLMTAYDDIPPLVWHLVRKAATALHLPEPAVPKETMETILRHEWPGNVRELENCLTRGVVLARGQVLRPDPLFLRAEGSEESPGGWTLDELEGRHVKRVLEHTDGNRTRAAELLGISKPRLYRLLDKHGLR